MPVSAATYKQVALEDPEGKWELVCGRLRHKPDMTAEHNALIEELAYQLHRQLDRSRYVLRTDTGRVLLASGSHYVPDLFVLPRVLEAELRASPGTFEVYRAPLPLVVEVWSPKTGEYDVNEKLREYQQRGDAEIWRIHPYEKTLTRWVRQPGGSYAESTRSEGDITPAALPDVTIRISELFR